jgi:pyruvate,water dikinase
MLALRVRCLAGLRESPKFHIIQMMGIIRQGLLKSGQALVKEGVIDQAEDLFYLYYAEIEQLANNEDRDWRVLIDQRRASYQRELIRVQIPRLLISDGRTFYEGLTSEENQTGKLIGSPVSPGLVEGIVRVVLDPLNPSLQPGEIMVCPGTDPAWTPLFLTAGGLIMEVGGMMTHGAIVAREYGIPAVVGVDRARHVLQTGQKIQLNGTTGEILLMDQD